MWLLALFIAVPLIEIALFIQVGGWLTLWPTLGIVVGTAVLGAWLVRLQGHGALSDVQRSLDRARDPLEPLAHGVMILFSGALLLTPGFLTDAIGFALLVPPVRVVLLRWILRHSVHRVVLGGAPPRRPGAPPFNGNDDVIEPEFHDVTPPEDRNRDGSADSPRRAGGSGWTRH